MTTPCTQPTTWTLRISDWAAFSPVQSSRDSASVWQDWAQSGRFDDNAEPRSPDLAEVPAMLRRRLSPLGKSALHCVYQILRRQQQTPPQASIFCSQHGDVERTVSLLQELATDQPLSPTAFSLSVHNATAGIYSIASHVTHPITAISAGADGVFTALLEAWLLMQSPDIERVLCVIYDDRLPAVYPSAEPPCQIQAFALLLEQDNTDSSRNSDTGLRLQLSLQPQTPLDVADSRQINDAFLQFLIRPDLDQYHAATPLRRWQASKLAQA